MYNVCDIAKTQEFLFILSPSCRRPKNAHCETVSNKVAILDSSFTHEYKYFQAALQEATEI